MWQYIVAQKWQLQGPAQVQCIACCHQAYFVPAAFDKAQAYAQVAMLLLELVSQRAIVRLTGLSRLTIVKLATEVAATLHLRPKPSWPQVFELDEMWTLVGRKKRKV